MIFVKPFAQAKKCIKIKGHAVNDNCKISISADPQRVNQKP